MNQFVGYFSPEFEYDSSGLKLSVSTDALTFFRIQRSVFFESAAMIKIVFVISHSN